MFVLNSCTENTTLSAEDELDKAKLTTFINAQPGFYKGTTSCIDCEEILTIIELKDDETAILFETYIGKEELPYTTFGTWSSSNENITFTDGNGDERLYKATSEGLIAVDLVDSDNKNILNKYNLTIDFTKPFIAEGRYFYMADAHIFTFMGSEKVYPVITNQENFKIEQQFLKLSDDEQKCFCIQVKGRITEADDMEGRKREHFEIEEFLGTIEKPCAKEIN